MRRRDRQAARAGPDVDAPRRLELASHRQVFGDDEFRLRARDQHVGRDRKGQREKLLAAHEVGHRRPARPLEHQLAEALARRLGDFIVEMGVKLDSLAFENMGQHDLSVQTRALRSLCA